MWGGLISQSQSKHVGVCVWLKRPFYKNTFVYFIMREKQVHLATQRHNCSSYDEEKVY